jgi:gliding motility-associated-like protein
MSGRILYSIHLLLIVFIHIIDTHGQIGNKPAPPVIYYVSVQPETGYVEIVWNHSPSTNVHYYKILIAKFTGGPSYPPAYIEIGRVPATDSVFIYQDSESSLHSDGYTVESVDSISGLSDFNQLVDSTIFLSAVFDSCSSDIVLEWNDYNRWRGNISRYNLYRKINNKSVEIIKTFTEGNNEYTLDTIEANNNYGFYIETINNDGIRKSTSNIARINTGMSKPPDYINADYASITDNNNIELSFTVDPDSELNFYKLYRSGSADGPFNIIDSFYRYEPKFIYIDNTGYTSGVYYYRLTVLNNCNQPSTMSNVINNILLSGENNNLTNTLTWNGIADWPGDVEFYQLIRITGESTDMVDTIYEGDLLVYRDDLNDIVNYNDPINNYFCYMVRAKENNNPNIKNSISYSNEICLTIDSDIRMPNAFIPNSNINNKFGPVYTFKPESYRLTIFNRWGLKVWEGNEPWDGTINGKPATEGVYLYHIKIYTYNNDADEMTGHVTLLYR